jgi:endogenous inhibitor of DNA gyrase (YacG/DUF329 family)
MSAVRCPTCQIAFEPASSDALPFCGERCRQIDLNRWLEEEHGLPHEAGDEAAVEF